MRIFDDLFSYLGQSVGQLLITRSDLADREAFESMRRTLTGLLNQGVIVIMNENDSLAADLRFGDNDTMSAHVAACVGADYLFMLTDVDALYDSNPSANPEARPITDVHDIDKMSEGVQIGSSGSGTQWGTGGMETKIRAARIAVTAGVRAVITHAQKAETMAEILEQRERLDAANAALVGGAGGASAGGAGAGGAAATTAGGADRATRFDDNVEVGDAANDTAEGAGDDEDAKSAGYVSDGSERIGTVFHPVEKPVKEKKRWITHGLVVQGSVVLDDGAVRAVASHSTLFAAGIIDVRGDFPRNAGVLVCDADGNEIARGCAAYSSEELRKAMGLRSHEIKTILGEEFADEVIPRQRLVTTIDHEGVRMEVPDQRAGDAASTKKSSAREGNAKR